MKRKTTEDERKLFQTAHRRSDPEAQSRKSSPRQKSPKPRAAGLTATPRRSCARDNSTPGARIDLHGMTEAAAHRALLGFLVRAQSGGVRLALVITGVGNPGAHEGAEWMRTPHGVLKEMVPRWLNEKDFAPLTSGWARAHRRHGGDGALYVYLRKQG